MTDKLLFIVNDPAFFISHRLPIAVEAIKQGYEVHLASFINSKEQIFAAYGIKTHNIAINRGSTNPLTEIKTLFSIWNLFNHIRPDIAHLVTMKPVLYGGIAARFAPVKSVVSAVPGLGSVFLTGGIRGKFLRFVVSILYKIALKQNKMTVIFQNPDDKKNIRAITRISEKKTIIIRGSGVDLSQYSFTPLPDGTKIVVMAARLLRDKGVFEFAEAAKILKERGSDARFCLIGNPDPQNPSSINEEDLSKWKKDGHLEIWGYRDNIAKIFAEAYMVVLPSYSEGLPKVLIEAAACGRAVVTTDVSGCRDAIEKDITGTLVPVRNSQALADAMGRLIQDRSLCEKMGKAGRKLAEKEFDINKVVEKHLDIYKNLRG